MDADYFDAATSALSELISTKTLTSGESLQLQWSLSGLHWVARHLQEAERLAVLVRDAPGASKTLKDVAARQVGQIRAGQSALGPLRYPEELKLPHDAAPSKSMERLSDGGTPSKPAVVTHAPRLDASWGPYFLSSAPGLADAIDDGDDLPITPEPLRVSVFSDAEFAPIPTADIGRASRYLLLSRAACTVFGSHLPPDAVIRSLSIEGEGEFVIVDLTPIDCLVEAKSFVTRARSGRIKIARGMFDSSQIEGLELFRPIGSHEIFVHPKFAPELRRAVKAAGLKGMQLRNDVASR